MTIIHYCLYMDTITPRKYTGNCVMTFEDVNIGLTFISFIEALKIDLVYY